jgi:delta-aminolevulinic acid dehydratase/porphobilinogen synthase
MKLRPRSAPSAPGRQTGSYLLETLIAIKRAGADFILSYAAKDVAARLPG